MSAASTESHDARVSTTRYVGGQTHMARCSCGYSGPIQACATHAEADIADHLREAGESPTRCPVCGGFGGAHGYVHVRHGNGGGHNKPCPHKLDGPADVAPSTSAPHATDGSSTTPGDPSTISGVDGSPYLEAVRAW